MEDIVFAAFFASGGLNAWTPLAMASTPVRATEPDAKALRSRKIPSASVPIGSGLAWRGSGCAWPVAMWMAPVTTMSIARARNT